MKIKHKCTEWAGEVRIHPDVPWLWGTHFEYYPKDGNWLLMDDTSETFSIWQTKNCPFCKTELDSLL